MKKALLATSFAFLFAITLNAAPEAQLGAVLRHAGAHDISIIYTEPVNVGSLGDPENYHVIPGNIIGLRLGATNTGSILTVTGLATGLHGAVTITNMFDTGGAPIPDATVEFDVTDRLWATIGANELGFPADVVGMPKDGFDLWSGGVQQRDEYDDATFVGEQFNGDFEVKVRVEYVEPAGAGAKAGIMIREKLDEGKPRPLDPENPSQAFSRYVELSVQAPASVLNEPGAEHQIWQRPVSTNLETISLTVTSNAPPAYTNAWLRIVRRGQQFTMYRGINGVNWTQIGEATFDPPLTNNPYVGLAFSPQNDDIPFDTGLRKSFVAKFREYELIPIEGGENNLRIQLVGDQAEVLWDSNWTLQTAPTVTGQWNDLTTATSPYRVNLNEPMRFFRLRQ
jgi:hypothetical protein